METIISNSVPAAFLQNINYKTTNILHNRIKTAKYVDDLLSASQNDEQIHSIKFTKHTILRREAKPEKINYFNLSTVNVKSKFRML